MQKARADDAREPVEQRAFAGSYILAGRPGLARDQCSLLTCGVDAWEALPSTGLPGPARRGAFDRRALETFLLAFAGWSRLLL